MRNLDDDDEDERHDSFEGSRETRSRAASAVPTSRHLSDFTIQLARADEEHFHIDDRVELSDCTKYKREMMETLNDYKQQK